MGIESFSRRAILGGMCLWTLLALMSAPAFAQGVSEDAALLMRFSKAEAAPKGVKAAALERLAGHLQRDERGPGEEAWRALVQKTPASVKMGPVIEHVMWRTVQGTHPDLIQDARRAAERVETEQAIERQIDRLKQAHGRLKAGSQVSVRPLEVDVSDTPRPPRLGAARSLDADGLRDEVKSMRRELRYARKQSKMARLRLENGLRRAPRLVRRVSSAWRMLNGIAMARR